MANEQPKSPTTADLRRELISLRGQVYDLQIRIWAMAIAGAGALLLLTLALPWSARRASAEDFEDFGRSDYLSGWGMMRAALAHVTGTEGDDSFDLFALLVFLAVASTLVVAGVAFAFLSEQAPTWRGLVVMTLGMTYGIGMVLFGIAMVALSGDSATRVAAAPWIASAAGFALYGFAKEHRFALEARELAQVRRNAR